MKLQYIFIYFILTFILISCSNSTNPITLSQLEEKANVFYLRDTETPYSGKISTNHYNGTRNMEMTLVDGKIEGMKRVWYEDGKKNAEINYKDGKLNGNWIKWSKSGNIYSE